MLFLRFCGCLLIALLPTSLLPAGNMLTGARAAGMANASVAIYDFWGISHNQAGIARLEHPAAALYTENRFMITEMSLAAVACVLPTAKGNFGLSLTVFGNHLYGEGKAGLAYARAFGERMSAGIQLDYLFVSIGEGYGSKGIVAAELGIIYEVLPNMQIGAHIFNPTRALLTQYEHLGNDERITTIIRTGLSYTFSDKVLLSLEAEKDIRHLPVARVGAEYTIAQGVTVRTGLSTNPMHNTFGFGLHTGQWQIDIASSYHYILGYSPQAGVVYTFR